jgi:hypothetical protein
MKSRQPKLDEERVNLLYKRMAGEAPVRGRWDPDIRRFAERVVYVEDACRSVIRAIGKLQTCSNEEIAQAKRELELEFSFLNTLQR